MSHEEHYLRTIERFGAQRILVIGDMILDIYLKGTSTRLCPEAPVPVVDVAERIAALGGAANTACNVKALGAGVVFCTVIGEDAEGTECLNLLEAAGIDCGYIITTPTRKTLTKSRVVSGSHVITRVDQGSTDEVDTRPGSAMIELIERAYNECDAVIISDYDKGIVTKDVVDKICELRSANDKFTMVDSRRLAFFSRLQPSCAKPNYDEALKVLDSLPAKNRIAQISEHAQALYEKINAPLILATLDVEGCLLIENGRATEHLRANKTPAPFVSGAGDTFVSAFALSWLASGDAVVSAKIAVAAASIAIEKHSTAACSQAELRTFFNVHVKYIARPEDLETICDTYRANGRKIVFTNGCFDILHSGHVSYLHKARQMGDVLIVGLNTDESIRRIKGNNRPINTLADRIHVLAGLSSVDHIIPFGDRNDDTPVSLIRVVRPDIFAKGGDYIKERLPEAGTVEAFGGQIVLIDHVPDHSTTRIIGKIKSLARNSDPALSEWPS